MMSVAVAILLALFCSIAVLMAEQPALKPVVVFVEDDSRHPEVHQHVPRNGT